MNLAIVTVHETKFHKTSRRNILIHRVTDFNTFLSIIDAISDHQIFHTREALNSPVSQLHLTDINCLRAADHTLFMRENGTYFGIFSLYRFKTEIIQRLFSDRNGIK